MSNGINQVTLFGNLGATPELRFTSLGTPILKMRIATNDAYYDKDKKLVERVDWHDVAMFGARAEPLSRLLNKGDTVVGEFGVITLANGVEVGDKIYYRGYSNNVCHEGPLFTDTEVVFDRVDGFHYLAFCSWGIQANDKCADFEPQSGDCTAATCQPDFID